MKRNRMKRILLLMAAVLLAAMPGLAAQASGLTDLLSGGTSPVRIVLSAPEIRNMDVFDEKRVGQLNLLIKHFSYAVTVDGSLSDSAFAVDGDQVYSVLTREEPDSVQEIYSFRPDVVLQHKPDSSGADSGVRNFTDSVFIRLNTLADLLYPFFSAMPEHFGEYAREEKASMNFKGYGKAARRVTVSFSADKVGEQFPELLLQCTDSEECRAFLKSLVFSGPQRFILLFDENGVLLRVSYDGKAGIDEADLRKVSLVWKCVRTGTLSRDSLTLKTPAVSGYNRNNIEYNRELDMADPEHQSYSWEILMDQKTGQERAKIRFSAALTESGTALSGKAEYTEKKNNQAATVTIIPELAKENAGEYSGTLEIANYSGKIVKNRIVLHLTAGPGDSISWEPAGSARTVDLDSPEGKSEGEELQNSLIQRILMSILKLPDTDTVFISDGIPAETWNEIIH